MRTLRGMLIRAIAIACVLAGSSIQADHGPLPLAAGPAASLSSAPRNPQGLPTFTPQPLYLPAPQGVSHAGWNGPVMGQPGMVSHAMYAMPYGQNPYGAMGVQPAAYGAPGLEPPPNASFSGPGYPTGGYDMGSYDGGGYDMDGGMGMGMDGYGYDGGFCPQCGGGGCSACGGHHGVLGGFLRRLLPYGEGGACAPRWYDIGVDALYWTRDEVSDFVPFTAFTRFGDTIMSSDDLDYDYQPGMRLNANLQLMPGVALDMSYFGLFSWSANTSVTSPINELFSPYSGFGALIGVGTPFDESDQAQFHSLRSSTTIDNFEIGIRKYWTGPNCRLQGSYRSGVRYIYLVEDLNFFTLGRNVPIGLGTGPAGRSSTDVRTHNSLVGYQAGMDLWASIVPGVSIGTDLKAGVYGNHAKYNTRVFGSTTAGGVSADLFETNNNADIAVVGEANLLFLWRTSPNLTIRGGYSVLYIDGLALAPENFNANNPFNTTRPVIATNTDGYALYHGGFVGFEWMW